jgi:hypothetical protein
MPPPGGGPPTSFFEFWPAWLFYAPIWLWIICLMLWHRGIRLPLIANPGFPAGGLVGEEKSLLFERLRGPERGLLPDYVVIERNSCSTDLQVGQIVDRLGQCGLRFPLVAKPDIGCRGAGVRPIADVADLGRYVDEFPDNARFLLQRMIDVEGEAGVFYVRPPGHRRGQILSLTLKYFPRVLGNGRDTLGSLITGDRRAGRIAGLYLDRFRKDLGRIPAPGEAVRLVFSGSHSKGAIFRDGSAFVTEAMSARFDRIADGIAGFHYGRFDVRFEAFSDLQRGENFAIIEYNGAGAEMTHIWDSRTSLFSAWGALCRQFTLLFAIGAANRRRGLRPESWGSFLDRWKRERRLSARYPSTL